MFQPKNVKGRVKEQNKRVDYKQLLLITSQVEH